jgi:hypothetical protein
VGSLVLNLRFLYHSLASSAFLTVGEEFARNVVLDLRFWYHRLISSVLIQVKNKIVRKFVLALWLWDHNFVLAVLITVRVDILRSLALDVTFTSICSDNLAVIYIPLKMKSLAVFACNYLFFTLCRLAQADMRSHHYIVDPSLDNKVSNTSVLAEHQSLSLIECAARCEDRCSCFGFNAQQRKCSIHQTCDPDEISIEETGWSYFSPVGMLSYIPYDRWNTLNYLIVCEIT